jgi:hypothetical protein
METLNPAILRQKSALELWQMRSRVISDLQAQATLTEGRQPNDYEQAIEERAEKNLDAIDKTLEENLRTQEQAQAFSRYSGIGSQQLSQRDNEVADWFREAISEKNSPGFTLEPEEKRGFSISGSTPPTVGATSQSCGLVSLPADAVAEQARPVVAGVVKGVRGISCPSRSAVDGLGVSRLPAWEWSTATVAWSRQGQGVLAWPARVDWPLRPLVPRQATFARLG